MALVYCEGCGAQLRDGGVAAPGGPLCATCAQAGQGGGAPAGGEGELVQFECCYCRSLLRLRAVAKRTRIKCPRCNDAFYLNPDGRVESRLEGNTTAVLTADQALRPLTPASGLGKLGPAPPSKTQPMVRPSFPPAGAPPPPEPDRQQALLDQIKPKTIDFLDQVPDKGTRDVPVIDMGAYETPAGAPLDLAPAPAKGTSRQALRPSDDGKLDLDPDGLRRKTEKFAKGGKPAAPGKKRKDRASAEGDDAGGDDAPRPGREGRDKRAEAAARRADELEAAAARSGLATGVLVAAWLAPLLLTGGLLSMTTRGAGFATRGAIGDGLRGLGQHLERGTRALGSTVNGSLPEGWRLPSTDPPR